MKKSRLTRAAVYSAVEGHRHRGVRRPMLRCARSARGGLEEVDLFSDGRVGCCIYHDRLAGRRVAHLSGLPMPISEAGRGGAHDAPMPRFNRGFLERLYEPC